MGLTLTSWITQWSLIANLAPEDMYLLPGMPKSLGATYPKGSRCTGELCQAFAGYLGRIERRIASDLIAPLRKISPSLASSSLDANKLGQVKDFGTIANASQQVQGVPMLR